LSRLLETPIDISSLLREEAVLPHYQPIVSMKRRSIVGFEGLSRGWDTQNKSMIPAPLLFESASQQGLSLELDYLCRSRILEEFGSLLKIDPEFILTLNIDSATVLGGSPWNSNLKAQVAKAGLTPRNVVIEILESAVKDVQELLRFVASYREAGYLIAMDDVGAGHSNLNRIPLVKPDIIKVDRFLVEGVDRDFYKQEVFKSVLSMARHLGTVIIAEGVETEGELATLLELGVDMIQGYYFGRPRKIADLDLSAVELVVEKAGEVFKEHVLANAGRKHINMAHFQAIIRELKAELAKHDAGDFVGTLVRGVRKRYNVECVYVLDDSGRQITDMIFNTPRESNRSSAMFRPLPILADHSLRDYFYFLKNPGFHKTTFATKPYVSMVTGNLCVTIAAKIMDLHQHEHILCMDVHTL